MPKVRSITELQDRLDRESSYRKRELSHLLTSAKGAPAGSIRRASIPLAYAHLEGFVKSAFEMYLRYVASLKPPFTDLVPPLSAIGLSFDVPKGANHNIRAAAICSQVRAQLSGRLTSVPKAVVDTESNLSFRVLENIYEAFGVTMNATLQKRDSFVDLTLKRRNLIAHGQLKAIDHEIANETILFVRNALDLVKTDLVNSASQKKFLA